MSTVAVFEAMIGKVMNHVIKTDYELIFRCVDGGDKFRFYHAQDCCERVWIDDICGELEDLCGSPLLEAESVGNPDPEKFSEEIGEYEDSITWTFYKFSTAKGSVTVRWCGTSNGYYSEEVDFEHTKATGEA